METVKNRTIALLLILVVILFIINISSCNYTKNNAKNLSKEQALRLNLEEKAFNLEKDVTKLKETLNSTGQDFDTTKKLLAEQLLINENLKNELQKTKDVASANLDKTSKKR